MLANTTNKDQPIVLTKTERQCIELACLDITHKEIADRMKKSPRTITGLLGLLYWKIGVKGRIGLVIWAIRQGIYKP